jgi:hypothetical protein
MKLGTIALVVGLLGCGGKKEDALPPPRVEQKLQIYATAERNPDGSAAVRIFADALSRGTKVVLLGHEATLTQEPGKVEAEANLTIPLSELQPGFHDYPIAAELTTEYDHGVGTGSIPFNAYADVPPITWHAPPHGDLGATFKLPDWTDSYILGKLDADGNAVFTATVPAGMALTVAGTRFVADGTLLTVKVPVAATAAGMSPWPEGDALYTFHEKVLFDGGGEGGLNMDASTVFGALLGRALAKQPALFPGEAPGTGARRSLWNASGSTTKLIGKAATVKDIDLVGSTSTKERKLSSCRYQGDFVVRRREETVTATVVDRRSGKVVATKTFRDRTPSGSCPREIQANVADGGSDWLFRPDPEDIERWMASLIQP